MLFNHKGVPVWAYVEGESKCPECERTLIARKPEHAIWHWAHKPEPSQHSSCPWEESEWHLRWKAAQLGFAGWTVEHKVIINGKRYILDAYHEESGRVREFVHSLSPYYVDKHLALANAGMKVTWIYDGGEFASERRRGVSKGGVKKLLKPRASEIHGVTGGYVHLLGGEKYPPRLMKLWRGDVWYPNEVPGALQILALFDSNAIGGLA